MKKYILILALLLPAISVIAQNRPFTADEVMQKTIDKLNSLKTVSYDYRRELNYASERFFHELKAAAYLDLTSNDKLIGARFRFTEPGASATFNGSELFFLKAATRTLYVSDRPGQREINENSYLVNSPLMLKNVLPRILEDKAIPKKVSVVNGQYLLEFTLENYGIDFFGKFSDQKLARKSTYQVAISATDFMPAGVLQKNGDVDFIKTEFTNISEKPPAPAEKTWFYSTYLGEYKHAEPQKDTLLKPEASAPAFKLPLFGEKSVVSLADLRGKVVLLEFFIFHCGASIDAVPSLNSLHTKYKDRNFKLFAVNLYDSEELVGLFIKSKNAAYPVLYQGEKAAKEYGVFQYPTAVLIGKDGKVLYAGPVDAAAIDALIAKNL